MPTEIPTFGPAADHEDRSKAPERGIGLCLSGGGFRAMLFHAGALLQLNELGLLGQLDRVSSVSGGSITAGVLALNWPKLKWQEGGRRATVESVKEHVVNPLRRLSRATIDLPAIGWGTLLPWRTITDGVISAYNDHLFGGATLQELQDEVHKPEEGKPKVPRFVFTATNVKTGSLWRFAKPYMADYRVGQVKNPEVPLAVAVAASSAFPPFLSPVHLDLDPYTFEKGIPENEDRLPRSLRATAVLTDGGVYDNLGLQPIWDRYETVLVSDGGKPSEYDLDPASDWARHSRRLLDLLQQQIGNLRVRQIMNAFTAKANPRPGTYWGINTNAASYPAPQTLSCPHEKTAAIAQIDTRLAALDERDQERLLNWGYAVCNAAVRSYLKEYQNLASATAFPFPDTGIG
jgi:NTE family protein